MNITLILFIIGILGFVLNRKNIILMLISIEIMLLSITFLILVSSLNIDDIIGQTYAIYIIAVAGAESAIGLGILVAFYRLKFLPKLFPYISFSSGTTKQLITPNSFLGVRFYSTEKQPSLTQKRRANKLSTLNSSFITGFIDAEGSFVVTILKNSRYRLGWTTQARFQLKLHEKDRDLVLAVQDYFNNIGYISKINIRNSVEFRVTKTKDLDRIISHFNYNPLITNKYADFMLFKEIYSIILNNKHNTLEGLQKILNKKAALNWGLSDNLKENFPLTLAVERPKVLNTIQCLSPEWIAGFCTGESNFSIFITGKYASVRFSVSQDSRDVLLLENIGIYLNCGIVNKYKNREVCELVVSKIDDIITYIIPFFEKYSIRGSKYENYLYFKEAAFIIKNKQHLTKEGIDKIIQLKAKINKEN
jgi:NADH:ubiquinone oxidoreductase subunit K